MSSQISHLVEHPIVQPKTHTSLQHVPEETPSTNRPSLEPANNYALQDALVNELPIVQPESNTSIQQVPLQFPGLVSESSGFQPTPTTRVQEPATVSEERSNIKSVSRGRKRKGEDILARPSKKRNSKDTENADMADEPSENITGKEHGEGTTKSCEVRERAGKPTLSGRVPLMPTHLAEAGY
jgi:hypothetical protein